MILIADSGSTKASWQLLNASGVVAEAQTVGFNPYYQDAPEIAQILSESLLPQLASFSAPQEIFFYGAGCSAEDKKAVIASALQQNFPEAITHVHHDLEAAARALCGNEPGIACILGTGSNSCLYDGEQITYNVPNLGFILGDEGSGGYMGKRLVQAFLTQELPADVHEAFQARYNTNRDEIVDNVYRKPYPNRYMAAFTRFLSDHREHPFVHQMIYQSLADFFEKNITKYEHHKELDTHFVGSIAFYFKDILLEVAKQYGVRVRHIIKNPITGLSLYHQHKLTV